MVRAFKKRIKASLTVEAAILMPIFILAVVAFISLINIIYTQMCVEDAINYTATKLQTEGVIYEFISNGTQSVIDKYESKLQRFMVEKSPLLDNDLFKEAVSWSLANLKAVGENKIFITIVEENINGYLKDTLYDFSCIEGGVDGIDYSKCKLNTKSGVFYIEAEYKARIPILFSKSVSFNKRSTLTARMFGANLDKFKIDFEKQEEVKSGETSKKVYITKTGEVYHLQKDCVYLKSRVLKTTKEGISDKRNESGGKYYPCERCVGDKKENNRLDKSTKVYYCTYGNRYHIVFQCPAISRTIFETDIDKIGDRKECEKCGKS